MHTQNRRHRLFIAMPLFALCVTISMVGGLMQSQRASLEPVRDMRIVAEAEQRMVEVTGGALRLESDAVLQIENGMARLVSGQVLVLADEWLSVQVGDAILTGWKGGWYVSVNAQTVSVAALTTPVRIDHTGKTTIIPARMQMTSIADGTLLPLPSHFLREQLPAILDRADQLPDARISVSKDDRDPVLLSLHPERRASAWTLPLSDDVPMSERILRVKLLPVTDRLSSAVPAQIVRFWADDLAELLKADESSGSFLQEDLPMIAEYIVTLHRDGYPDRARRFASALQEVLANAPASARSIIRMLQNVVTPAVSVAESKPSSSAPSSTTIVMQQIMDASEMTAAVTDHLLQAGFMFTTQTIIVLKSTFAEVSAIVLGTPSGDQLLHFSYDPVTNLVSSIEQDGQILPFSLPLEKYAGWVKK